MLTSTNAPRVSNTHYYKDGKAYARVTSVLDSFTGRNESGAAAAVMTAMGVQDVIESFLLGDVHPRMQEHVDAPLEFLSSNEGRNFMSDQYFRVLGRYSDMGTVVDLAFRVMCEGAMPTKWSDWIDQTIDELNATRELTYREYTEAVESSDIIKVRELSEKPRFAVMIDRSECAARIENLHRWYGEEGLDMFAWQITVYDEELSIAGTPDGIAKDDDGYRIIDVKATNSYPKHIHGTQVVVYGDMWSKATGSHVESYSVVYAQPDKVHVYDVHDVAACRQLFSAALCAHKAKTPFGRKGTRVKFPQGLGI